MWRLTEAEAIARGYLSASDAQSHRKKQRAGERARKSNRAKTESFGEALLMQHIVAEKVSPPRRWFRFCPTRKWEADFAWIVERLIVEVDGGTHAWGGHNSTEGYRRDRARDTWATLNGWTVLRFTIAQVRSLEAIDAIKQFFEERSDASE